MKRLSFLIGCLIALSQLTNAQSGQDEMMKAWQAYMTPGDMHALLAKDDGEWKTEMSLWMDPGSPPTKTSGKMINKMILGGRYQEARYSGDFMGMPMEGIGITGYDNAKKVFISTWIDNLGSGIMKLEGQYDPATKAINFYGSSVDPITGKEMKVRELLKFVDDKNQLMEMFMIQDGKEIKTMEIKFTKL